MTTSCETKQLTPLQPLLQLGMEVYKLPFLVMPKIVDCLNSLFVVAARSLAMSSVVFSLADVESYMARDEATASVLVKHSVEIIAKSLHDRSVQIS